jgi:hypothetical protein
LVDAAELTTLRREAIEKERKRKQHQEAYASGKTAEVRTIPHDDDDYLYGIFYFRSKTTTLTTYITLFGRSMEI